MIKKLTYHGVEYDKYSITSDGKLIGVNNRELSTVFDKSNREKVSIKPFGKKGCTICVFIHRAVAENFLERKEGQDEVHHIDKNRLNNNSTNLMWVSAEEHDVLHKDDFKSDGIHCGKVAKGIDNNNVKLTESDVIFIRENYKPRDRQYGARALGRKFDISHSTVVRIVQREDWKHI